jgi:hypothetical protein
MTTPNWRLLAAQKFIGIAVHGVGRWAVISCDKKSCYLCATEDNARAAALGACHMVVPCRCEHEIRDLQPCPYPAKCKDFGYSDREERRKYGA